MWDATDVDDGGGDDETTDFDAIVRDVGERLTEVADPRVSAVLGVWVARLAAAGGRGPVELDYLRLLRFMMANRRIGRPFRRHPPPPAVRLPPLDACLRPRAGAEAGRRRRAPRASRGGGGGHEDGWSERDECYGADNDDASAAAVSASYADGVSSECFERDGHLAGGGGKGTVCWDASAAATATNPAVASRDARDENDPCLDDWAPHMRKRRPGPIGAAYRHLLGDCLLPQLSDADRAATDPQLLRVVQDVNDETTLQEFYFKVSLHTCDQGSLMMKMADDMVDKFRAFVSDVFDGQVEHVSDGLAYEQMSARHKYAFLRDRALNRATVVLEFLREAMPTFSWHKYRAEPDAYLKRQVLRRRADETGGDATKACDDGDGTGAGGCGGDDDGGGGDDDDDDDDDGARRQSAVKKMMYTLNWLRSEETHTDCHSEQLYEQWSDLSARLTRLNEQMSAAQCRSAGDIGRHKDEVTLLRQKSVEQAATIDRLIESIQLMKMDKKSQPDGC